MSSPSPQSSPHTSTAPVAFSVLANGVCQAALKLYSESFWADNAASVAVWAPLHFLNFRFVPITYRMPFIVGAGLLWSVIFSKIQYG